MATLHEVAIELYGLPPDQFTATRTTRAKEVRADGDRELAGAVAGLRKPTVAAWVVNLLVRHDPDEVNQLLTLGTMLREAQAALAGDELRELNKQRHQVLAAVVRRAAALARSEGNRVSDAVRQQVEATLRAAMSDPEAGDLVRTGLLTRDLEGTGFEPVNLAGAAAVDGAEPLVKAPGRRPDLRAVPDPPPERRKTPARTTPSASGRQDDAARREAEGARAREIEVERERARQEELARRRREAEEDVLLAERAEEEAIEARQVAEEAVVALEERSSGLASEVGSVTARIEELTERLAGLQDDARRAAKESRRARSARDAAIRAAEAAVRRAETARDQLAGL